MKRKNKVKIEWSEGFAYSVGIIATDGNLSSDGRHINITSKDNEIIAHIATSLKIDNKIGRKSRSHSKDKKYYFLQFGDKNFYEFLLKIGLTPAKSKTIGRLKIPKEYYFDFLRGCIDGDGSITITYHKESKLPQLRIRLCSASKKFLDWIKDTITLNSKISGGWIYSNKKGMHTLSYGKNDSIKILKLMYHKKVEYFLKRKYDVAVDFIGRVVK